MKDKGKLCLIELDSADKVRGNYIIMTSGAVKHIPNHKYLVSQHLLHKLTKEGIKFKKIEC